MTIVYPLKKQRDHTELMYSLRSIEKYLPGYEVVIVGSHIPQWLTNVTHIDLPDIEGRKQLTIKLKIFVSLCYSEEILFMNDDVYLLEPPHQFKYYYQGDLSKHTSEAGAAILQKELKRLSKGTKDFDGHYPIVYGQDFKEALYNFHADGIIKSAYCNYLGIEGHPIPDCKIISKQTPEYIREYIKTRPAFSSGVSSISSVAPILQELFPSPSKYEI